MSARSQKCEPGAQHPSSACAAAAWPPRTAARNGSSTSNASSRSLSATSRRTSARPRVVGAGQDLADDEHVHFPLLAQETVDDGLDDADVGARRDGLLEDEQLRADVGGQARVHVRRRGARPEDPEHREQLPRRPREPLRDDPD